MAEWQPIKTAPKDGTEVLLYDSNLEETCIAFYDRDEWISDSDPVMPTHWMPLPAPPAA